MNKLICFLIIALIYCCHNAETDIDGFVMSIECTEPILTTINITEQDIDSVWWDKQVYFLKNDTIQGEYTTVINSHLCYRACRLRCFLNKHQLYSLPVFAPTAPLNLPINGKPALLCNCESCYSCLFDSSTLHILQKEYIPIPVEPVIKNEKIRTHFIKLGKLR